MNSRLVIIPTYNEKENIITIVRDVLSQQPPFDLLVVDDNSPDGTAALVKGLASEFPDRLFIEERKGKLGLGTAYIHGFKWALEKGYDYIFEMDADFSHKPADLPRLFHACESEGADVAIGSRYTRGGRVKNWPIGRILMSYFASVYANAVLWLGVSDTTAGFVCYRREVLQAINLDNIRFVGYAFQIEMKFAARQLGFTLREVPIVFEDRKLGTSKMSTRIFQEAFMGVLKMRLGEYKKGKKAS